MEVAALKRFVLVLAGLLAVASVLLLTDYLYGKNGPLTDLDVVTAAGLALEADVPEAYLFDDYTVERRRVRIGDDVFPALEIHMIYLHPETKERLKYVVYLDPTTAELLGYGAKTVLAPDTSGREEPIPEEQLHDRRFSL